MSEIITEETTSNKEVNLLVEKIQKISKKYEYKKIKEIEKAKNKGCKFNIFDVIGISTKEVYICRLLAELLDPKGCHAQETAYLDLFYTRFLKNNFNDLNTSEVTIIKEDLTKQLENEGKDKRRIDIVLNENNGHYIPIEVKINAEEQLDQCQDYLKQAEKYYKQRKPNKKPFVCFLTKSGYMPKSIKEEHNDQIICISWSEISNWIDACISISKGKAPIKAVLKQFKAIIKEYMEVSMDSTKEIIDYTCLNELTSIAEIEKIAATLKHDRNKLNVALKLYPAYLKATRDIWVKFAEKLELHMTNNYQKEPKNTDGKHWYLTYDLPNKYSIMIHSEARTELSSEDRLPTINIDVYKGNKIDSSVKYPKDLPTLFDLVDDSKIDNEVKQIGDWLSSQYEELRNS